MCCCQKDEPHDESMKFVIKYRTEEDLKVKLFKLATHGPLRMFDSQSSAPQMHYKLDKN
jgi:hypothetical protein